MLSTIPRGNYVIFDSDLKCKIVTGKGFPFASGNKDLFFDMDLTRVLELPFFAEARLDQIPFQNALLGITYEENIIIKQELYSFTIGPLLFPDHETNLQTNSNQKYVLLSCFSNHHDHLTEDKLNDILRKQSMVIEYEEELFREITEIFNWRKEMEGKGKHKVWMRKALPNLNTSLMQGSGLGGLVTSMGAMLRKAEKLETHAMVPLRNLELVEENFKSTKKLVKSLADAQVLFEETSSSQEKVDLQTVIDLIDEEGRGLREMLAIKKQNIVVSVLKNTREYFLDIHQNILRTAVREIFINAMKYSPEAVSIIVLFLMSEGKFIIKFINPTNDTSIQTLNFKEAEDLALFQPFFRLNKTVDERYDKEEFSLGLGLAVVKKVIEDMKGNIHINSIQSGIYKNVLRSGNQSSHLSEICITLEFPIL
ncbi:ATP-binding protein [Leptospira sp. 'Mane']|uniref:ATP-binding protein n=1 Tax=Leptospira sp. 'Mane' TaxID=3387407 RepID=UPI00398B6952